jgi:dTDP-4-amino-4,6-dideoxygalactose transaminase
MIICANPAAQFQSYQAEIEAAALRILRSNRYILGNEVAALEQEFADYIGTRKALGVANGTDALEIALRALEIGPGDEVITVSHTAVATVAAIEAAGALPVLVDVDPRYYTLDPQQLDEVLTARTRAVIAVHLCGQAADLDAIGNYCQRHSLVLIEDVSQAHGATWHGKRLGSIGRVGCFSCYPTKNLGAIGDAGLITTNDEALAERMRTIREYGWRERYVSEIQGRNSRLDELQAAILRIKLRYLDADNAKRRQIAARYTELLSEMTVQTPEVRSGAEAVFHLYVIRVLERQQLIDQMNAEGIFPGVHYPIPIHKQQAYMGRIRTAISMQVTESLAQEVLSLPLYPELKEEHLERVVREIEIFELKARHQ